MIVRDLRQVPIRALNEAQSRMVKCMRCTASAGAAEPSLTSYGQTQHAMFGHATAAIGLGWAWWRADERDDEALQVLADQPLEGWLCTNCQS